MNVATGGPDEETCLKEWTAAPDWFRTKVVGPRPVKEALDAVRVLQFEDAKRGSKVRKWSFQGWKGMATESVRWGLRDWSLIWESSGAVTPFTMTRLESSIGSGLRIDLQLTLVFTSPQERYVERSLGLTDPTIRHRTSPGALVGVSRRTDGYACGTVGRRTNPRYWRLYDKGVESQSAAVGHKWRLELETKGTLAEDLCKLGTATLTDSAFCARYCSSAWRQEGFSLPGGERIGDERIIGQRKRPPASTTALMSWLWTTVNPGLLRLRGVYTVDEILTALGLSDVATSRRITDA